MDLPDIRGAAFEAMPAVIADFDPKRGGQKLLRRASWEAHQYVTFIDDKGWVTHTGTPADAVIGDLIRLIPYKEVFVIDIASIHDTKAPKQQEEFIPDSSEILDRIKRTECLVSNMQEAIKILVKDTKVSTNALWKIEGLIGNING
jgi:hypothetical protein